MKENNELLERYVKWNRIKYFLSYYSDDYDDKCMKIRINSDDNLPFTKTLKMHNFVINMRFFMMIVIDIRSFMMIVICIVPNYHQKNVCAN